MIYDLAKDCADVLESFPHEHPRYRILKLLNEAVRRDVHFIDRHPTTLFQCLWNTCWWYDCPAMPRHLTGPDGGWENPLPWEGTGEKLYDLLEDWRRHKHSGFWLRSMRPPPIPLGTAQIAVLHGHKTITNGITLADEKGITSVVISPDGMRIASGSVDGTVRLWDAESGAQLQCLSHGIGHSARVTSVSFSRDGRQIFSTESGSVHVWDSASGTEVASLKTNKNDHFRTPLGTEHCCIAIGTHYKTARVWDVITGAELHSFLYGEPVDSVAISVDCRRFAVGLSDGNVYVRDAASGAELTRFTVERTRTWVQSLAFSNNGQRIASASANNVRVWDLASGDEIACLEGHEDVVTSVSFSPDDRLIVSGSEDQTARIWDCASWTQVNCLRGHHEEVTCAAFFPNSRRIVTGSKDNTVRIWDVHNRAEWPQLKRHVSTVTSVVFSPDGERIATGCGNGRPIDTSVSVLDADTGEERTRLEGHSAPVTTVIFSPDSRRIATSSMDYTVREWNTVNGSERNCFRGHTSTINSITFSPDGRRIASGSDDGTVRVWDTINGVEKFCFNGHSPSRVYCVTFSPDGKCIASGGRDRIVRIWNAADGSDLRHCVGHEDSVHTVAFTQDGKRIVSSAFADHWDSTTQRCTKRSKVRVWDALSGASLKVIDDCNDLDEIVSGKNTSRLRASARAEETIIEDRQSGRSVNWFPIPFFVKATHPSGRRWAAAESANVFVVQLEGDVDQLGDHEERALNDEKSETDDEDFEPGPIGTFNEHLQEAYRLSILPALLFLTIAVATAFGILPGSGSGWLASPGVALALSYPLWLYQLWKFAKPAMHHNERPWFVVIGVVAVPAGVIGLGLLFGKLDSLLNSVVPWSVPASFGEIVSRGVLVFAASAIAIVIAFRRQLFTGITKLDKLNGTHRSVREIALFALLVGLCFACPHQIGALLILCSVLLILTQAVSTCLKGVL